MNAFFAALIASLVSIAGFAAPASAPRATNSVAATAAVATPTPTPHPVPPKPPAPPTHDGGTGTEPGAGGGPITCPFGAYPTASGDCQDSSAGSHAFDY